jgi:hypothetical protein
VCAGEHCRGCRLLAEERNASALRCEMEISGSIDDDVKGCHVDLEAIRLFLDYIGVVSD